MCFECKNASYKSSDFQDLRSPSATSQTSADIFGYLKPVATLIQDVKSMMNSFI